MQPRQMRLWAVDADSFESIDDDLFYQTNWIQGFLTESYRPLLVATKGFGKTLLLKAKRLRLEKEHSLHLIPENRDLADRPAGRAPTFSESDIARMKGDQNYWEDVWALALILGCLRSADKISTDQISKKSLESLSNTIRGLWGQEELREPSAFFSNLLELNPRELDHCKADLRKLLTPMFRNLNIPMAVFVDNVDEYFKTHIDGWRNQSASASGALDPDIWYEAQAGLAEAIYSLHRQNHHIKIFASIRKEAYMYLLNHSEIGLQLTGSVVLLDYEEEDLKEIFLRNVECESEYNLLEPGHPDRFVRFFGSSNIQMIHPHVGESEHIWDYLLRHTLRRPRDLMAIGARISALPPEQRTRAKIRAAINNVSEEIARTYINEVRGHIDQAIEFDRIWPSLPSNILSREQISEIGKGYNTLGDTELDVSDTGYIHPICALYKCGLLGWVGPVIGDSVNEQKFEKPGEKIFLGNHVTPPSDYYIVHPSLDSLIRTHSMDYASSFNTLNIANSRGIWRDDRLFRGVLNSDVVGFSKINEDQDLGPHFEEELKKIVRESCGQLEEAKVEGGDRVILIDPNSYNLLKAYSILVQRLLKSRYKAELRCGAEYGVTQSGGSALRTSARLEPLSEPSWVLMTSEYVKSVRSFEPNFDVMSAEILPQLKHRTKTSGLFNLSKSDQDPDIYRELYAIDIHRLNS